MKRPSIRRRLLFVAALLPSLLAVALPAAEGPRRIEPDWFTRLGQAWVFNEGHRGNPGLGSFSVVQLPASGSPAGRLAYDFTGIEGGAYVGALLSTQVKEPLAEIRLTARRGTRGVILLRLIDSNGKTFQYKLQHNGAGAATDYKVDVRRPSQVWGGPSWAKDDKTIAWPLRAVFLGVEKSAADRADAGEAFFSDVELLTEG